MQKAFCNLWILALFLVYNKYLWHEWLTPYILILKLSHMKNSSSAVAIMTYRGLAITSRKLEKVNKNIDFLAPTPPISSCK